MINICQLVGACVIILTLDQIGRRKLAIGGGIAMMVRSSVMMRMNGRPDNRV